MVFVESFVIHFVKVRPSILRRVVVGDAFRAGVAVGFFGVGADEQLFLAIPFQLLAGAECNRAEVTDRGGTMAHLNRANGVFAAGDRVKQVAAVIVAHVEAFGIFRQLGAQQFGRAC